MYRNDMRNNKERCAIDKSKHQVFLFVCPGNLPFSFATHPWFVVNEKGVVSRWEVLFRKTEHETRWGHVYKNFFPAGQGIEILPFLRLFFWEGKLLGTLEGKPAQRMAEVIKSSPTSYPYRDEYFLTGPNSNTYAKWVIDQVPEMKVQLPWNAFGKNYQVK